MDAGRLATREEEIRQLIEEFTAPLLPPLGLSLWGVEVHMPGSGSTVRVFLENAASPDTAEDAGVNIDALADVSRQLSLILDVEDIFPGAYRLEGSSPGFERPFFSLDQLAGYVGETVDIRTLLPLGGAMEGRKKFKGQLTGVGETNLSLDVDGQQVDIA
jgi:ribosome maturation factor RimP